jgi:hypothetical protein
VRKLIWVLVVFVALFTIDSPAGLASASDGCTPLQDGKLTLEVPCGDGTIEVKVASSLTDACAELVCFGGIPGVVVTGEEGACTGAATLGPDGSAHTKAQCKKIAGTNTKIEITANGCSVNPCD